jgi:hypothetical protein
LISALTANPVSSYLDANEPVAFTRIAEIFLAHMALDTAQMARDAEKVALASPEVYPEAARIALDLAHDLYVKHGDTAGATRCALAAVQQLLRMRDEVSQAGAKAGWIMDALLRLRHIKGDEAQRLEDELEGELRRHQRGTLREMGGQPVDIVIEGATEKILDQFSKMDFSEFLRNFALLEKSPRTDELRATAIELAKTSVLGANLHVNHLDHEGKTTAKTGGAGDEVPPDDWFIHMIGRQESIRRATLVANHIVPLLDEISRRTTIEERHMIGIVWHSEFVPESQVPIWTLGLSRLFQGDLISAMHLLVPQLETSMRHILIAHGADPNRRRDDTTEESRSLDAIFANHLDDLNNIMGEPLVDELNRIFNTRPGPAFRHEIAHGLLSYGECYTHDSMYACWLLYRIAALFSFQVWEDRVGPVLMNEEPHFKNSGWRPNQPDAPPPHPISRPYP